MFFMKISKKAKISLGMSLGVVCAALGFTQLRVLNYANLDPQLDALDRAIRALAAASPEAALTAENKINSIQNISLSPKKITELRAALSPGWTLNVVGSPEAKSVLLQRLAFSRPSSVKADWPVIMEFIAELTSRPNFCVHSLSLSAGRTKSFNVLIVGTAPFNPN